MAEKSIEFREGALAMREMLSNFVEQGGNQEIAQSMRLNWSPSWGKELNEGDYQECSYCKKRCAVESMMRPFELITDDLVCDEYCAEAMNDRRVEP